MKARTVVSVVLRNARSVFGEYNRETNVEVPIDMAVQEPRARVVCSEAESDQVVGTTNVDCITLNGVVKVVGVIARRANYTEGMPVKVERMLLKIKS